MNKNVIILVLLILLGIAFYFYKKLPTNNAASEPAANAPDQPSATNTGANGSGAANNNNGGSPQSSTGPATVVAPVNFGGVTLNNTIHINLPGAGGYAVSKYIRPVNGASQPTLADWLAAMHTKEGFNTWIKNVRPFLTGKQAALFNEGSNTPSTGRWFIIDATHYIRVAYDTHGWVLMFMLITQPYKNDGVLNVPNILPYQYNLPQPDPTTWWASYDGSNSDGPSTTSGTPFF